MSLADKTALFLLTDDDTYVYENGTLPIRPPLDKEYLIWAVSNQTVGVRVKDTLPPSVIRSAASVVTNPLEADMILSPSLLKYANRLLIVRGDPRDMMGSKLRYRDMFKHVDDFSYRDLAIEEWERIKW